MRIHRATVRDFRNLASADLELNTQFHALVGPNGQGKTNTLEALYFVFGLRPLRSVPRRALIRDGADQAELSVRLMRRSTRLEHQLGVKLTPRSRTLLRDDKKVDARSYLGTAVAVSFTPDDLALGKGSPDRRRRFMDRALLNLYPAHLDRTLRYARVLKERNRLLSEGASVDVLAAYDEILARLGAAMTFARRALIQQLQPVVEHHFARIADPAPRLMLRYHPSLGEAAAADSEPEIEQAYLDLLSTRRSRDLRRGTTTLGPHLDDLDLQLEDQPAKERASQGQFRALALALKLAELTHLAATWGEPPILLLDDMSSELDRGRSRQLFDTIVELDGQVILTSTDPPEDLRRTLDLGSKLNITRVDSGTLVTDDSP